MKSTKTGQREIEEALLDMMGRSGYRPLTIRALLFRLGMSREQRLWLKRVLKQMVTDGRVARGAGHRYGPSAGSHSDGHVTGKVIFTRQGHGFLTPDAVAGSPSAGRPKVRGPGGAGTSRPSGDLFVPPPERHGACNGDRVEAVVLTGHDGRRYARVLRVLERNASTILGRFEPFRTLVAAGLDGPRGHVPARGDLGGRVRPIREGVNRPVRIMPGDQALAQAGDIVEVEVTRHPTTSDAEAIGRVVEVLGPSTDPAVDLRLIMREFDLPSDFPAGVLAQAEQVAKVTKKDMEGRRDLRDEQIFTIDGEDARDFDDAVSLDIDRQGNFHLGVHIADVSHFVKEGSLVEEEGRARATSVYLPECAIPMLPAILSDNVCSLVPGKDRLTMTCQMTFSKTGERVACEIFPSVIRSVRRLTYATVEALIVDPQTDATPTKASDVANRRALRVEYQDIYLTLVRMAGLARLMGRRRRDSGGLDFARSEPKVVVDRSGRVLEIKALGDPKARNLIEEFMVAANEAVAAHAKKRKLPMVYRIHETPDEEKFRTLVRIASSLELAWEPSDPSDPIQLQALLDMVKEHPSGEFMKTLVLRSLKQARYAPANVGHFGLASTGYVHFTSPIRRYPDLMAHRLIKHDLGAAPLQPEHLKSLLDSLEERCVHSSERERRAQQAERAGVATKMARYMVDHLGRPYPGRITGVAGYGLFVVLDDLMVDGLVPVESLPPDRYRYSENSFRLIGEVTGQTYRMGDAVTVTAVKADPLQRQVEFRLTTPPPSAIKRTRPRGYTAASPSSPPRSRGRKR